MDQLYTWGWPQWIAIIALSLRLVVDGTKLVLAPAKTPEAATASINVNDALFWTVILAAGGFWS